ncbi:alpha/beta fold hydrolase [Streptomyces sp. NPDC101249]|uniref:alpha/beta fold hydrolase n=1 Tax=Streptomyces sp. NPDC101249 TaxID=3366140 RepID=UPI0038248A41
MATNWPGTDTARVPREFPAPRPRWSAEPFDDRPAVPGTEYTTLDVPRDHTDPAGDRVTLAVSRLRAADPARRRGVLLAVNGGPGGDGGLGTSLPARFAETGLHQVYDLIGFDPRGTGASTPLYAEVHTPAAPFDSRPPDAVFPQLAEDMRQRELACQRGGGALRRHISTRNTARDMDLIRRALGESRISFVGYAYGAYVGAVYGSMFPAHLDRSVLDSCVGPRWSWREQFLWQGDAVHRNVNQWARWTGQRHTVFDLGRGRGQVLNAVERAAALLEGQPGGVRLRTLLDGAVGTRSADRARWAELARVVGALLAVAAPGGAGPRACEELLAEQSTWRPADSEGTRRIGVLEAVTLEHEWPADLEVYYTDMRDFRKRFPYGYGVLRAQPWVGAFRTFEPAEPPTVLRRDGYPQGLVVQADGDPMDHYAGGVAMAELLGHRLLTVTDSGEHEIYVLGANPRVDEVVHRYLVDGVLPAEDTTCRGAAARPGIPADAL